MDSDLSLQTLFEQLGSATALTLPAELKAVYGTLAFKFRENGPLVLGNFVSTLDGVVSLDAGKSGGGPISGKNLPDRMVMGLLRAVADVVMEGAGTLRTAPKSLLTAADICPALAAPFADLRRLLKKPETPLRVIVSGNGDLDLDLKIFKSAEAKVVILTGSEGAKKLFLLNLPAGVQVRQLAGGSRLNAAALVESLGLSAGQILLVEGGPSLLGSFLKDKQLHELFLTLAPQVAGRDASTSRPGLVSGQLLAPLDPRWAKLLSVKRSQNHLFLRYDFSGLEACPVEFASILNA